MNKQEFVKALKKAREYAELANKEQEKAIAMIEKVIDIETSTDLQLLGDTIEEAICCYVEYGENIPEDIWEFAKERGEYKMNLEEAQL